MDRADSERLQIFKTPLLCCGKSKVSQERRVEPFEKKPKSYGESVAAGTKIRGHLTVFAQIPLRGKDILSPNKKGKRIPRRCPQGCSQRFRP